MKQIFKNKSSSLLLMLIIVLTLSFAWTISAIAEGTTNPSITVGSTTSAVAPGDTVSIPVTISNNPGIATLGFVFTYDTNNLTLDSISSGTDGLCGASLVGNATDAKATWFQAADMTTNGTLFYLNFTVKNSAATNNYNVSAALIGGQATQLVNAAETAITATFVAGNIQVEATSITATPFSGSVVAAPLADHAATPLTTLYDTYSVSYQDGTATVTATNLRSHTNANSVAGYWVGVGMAIPADITYSNIQFGTSADALTSAGMTAADFTEVGVDYMSLYVQADNLIKSRTFYISFDGGTTVYSITIDCTNVTLYTGAADNTIDLADFVSGVYTISAGGEYTIAADAAGTIQITTTDKVTLAGSGMSSTANSGLSIDNTVVGVDLTIKDLYISSPVTDKNVIDFTGSGNKLTISGASLLENNSAATYYAAIHVPSAGGLTIDGDGTLYVYKNALGACIGGDCGTDGMGETNGDITIAGGTIFAKGSMTGATIGAGQSGIGGKVYITGGVVNLMTKARAAVIGGGGESGGVHGAGGDVYISGGTLLLYTDFTGSVIGCGNGSSLYTDGGNVYISGGSLKTVITNNAGSKWGTSTTENTVSDAAITATKLNNDTDNESVYLLNFDTSLLATAADTYTVDVDDDENFYTGAGHKWAVGTSSSTVNGGAFAADTAETNLYLYVTGKNHTLSVNNEEFDATWDSATSSFTVAPASTVWDGTVDTAWYNTTDTVFHLTTAKQLAGLAQIVNGTATGITEDNFTGKTVYLDNDIALNDHNYSTTAYTTVSHDSSSTIWTPIGNSSYAFCGTFNGGGHEITGMYIDTAVGYAGFFGNVSGTVTAFDLYGFVNVVSAVTGDVAKNGTSLVNDFVGGVVGKLNAGGTISYVTNYAQVQAKDCMNVGGIVGFAGTPVTYGTKSDAYSEYTANPSGYNTFVLNCGNNATMQGFYKLGGIVGENAATVMYCYNTGYILPHMHGSGGGWGGIAGRNGNNNIATEESIIAYCYNTGTITNNGKNDDGSETIKGYAGIAGMNYGGKGHNLIYNCYNIGAIPKGRNNYGSITNNLEYSKPNDVVYSNCSLDTTTINNYSQEFWKTGTVLSEADFKATTYTDTSVLALLGHAYVADTQNINNGYPVLRWQVDSVEPTLTSILILSEPTKTAYNATDVFDPTGMKVKALYSDGTYEILTAGYTYPTDALTSDITSVNISYGGQSTTQAITVNALTLNSIAITTAPIKTYYANGDSFDKTDMVVKATFNGTVVQTLDPSTYTVSPNPLTTGTTAVTVSYKYLGSVTQTATQAVTVMEALPTLTDGYYQLEDAQDLLWFANYVSIMGNTTANAKLVNNIDLTGVTWTRPIGTSTNKFVGIFDGNGKNISGFNNTAVTTQYFGILGYGLGATIKDLTVNATLTGTSRYMAAVIGYADGCTISNVTTDGILSSSGSYNGGIAGNAANASSFTDCVNNASIDVNGSYAGGISGYAAGSTTFSNCINNGLINNTKNYSGGIAGYAVGTGTISNCANNATVISTSNYVGGIVGYDALTGFLTECTNSAAVSGTYYVGGIVGDHHSTGIISKCVNSGNVTATSTATTAVYNVGGIAGYVYAASTIDQCYNSGTINGGVMNVGGIAGYLYNAASKVTNCYNIGNVISNSTSATANVGGVVGYIKVAGSYVQNCYNADPVSFNTSTSTNIGGVVGYTVDTTNVSNNYYLNTTATEGLGHATDNTVAVTSDQLKALATSLSSYFSTDTTTINSGYPILNWQVAWYYTVSLDNAITGGIVKTDKASVVEGDTVTLTVIPADGKQLKADTLVVSYNDSDNNKQTAALTSGANNIYTFTMPAYDVNVTAGFEAIPVGSINIDSAITGGNVSTGTANVAAGDTVTLTVIPDDGKQLKADTLVVSYNDSNNNKQTVALTSGENNTYTFIMPAYAVNITATFEPYYTVSATDDTAYKTSVNTDGVMLMTVNTGVTGLTYFKADIAVVDQNHSGNETVVFAHYRNGVEISYNATVADFDTVKTAEAGFKVVARDVIKVYIVDALTNAKTVNPISLQ